MRWTCRAWWRCTSLGAAKWRGCTPIRTRARWPAQLPYTCHLLGPELRAVADAFWARHPELERNVPRGIGRFAVFLREHAAAGALGEPLVSEVLAWEMVGYEIALKPPKRARRRPPFDDVPPGEFFVLVDGRGGQRRFTPVDAATADAVRRLGAGEALSGAEVAPLVERGIAVAV